MLLTVLSVITLLLSAWTFQQAMTHPAEPKSEKEKMMKNDFKFIHLMMPTAHLVKAITWSFAVSEILACMSSANNFTAFQTLDVARYCSASKALEVYPRERLPNLMAIGLAILLAGGRFRIASQKALGAQFTWKVTLKQDHYLVTSGPYAIVRHPSYLGAVSVMVGVSIAMLAPHTLLQECLAPNYPYISWTRGIYIGYVLSMMVVLLMRASKEDALMKSHFGKDWDAWARKVPYKFVPGVC